LRKPARGSGYSYCLVSSGAGKGSFPCATSKGETKCAEATATADLTDKWTGFRKAIALTIQKDLCTLHCLF
jgi:hypothetical protein